MKLKTWFVLSAGLNILLLVLLMGKPSTKEATRSPETPDPPPPVVERRTPPVKTGAKFDWRLVEAPDYRQYIVNLRSIGCPEETIQDIIIADVNKLYETRRQSLIKSDDDFKYWKAGQSFFSTTDPAKLQEEQKLRRQLVQEKRALLKELLGIDVPESAVAVSAGTSPQEKVLAFLPPEKRMQIADLEQKYLLRRMKGLPGGGGTAEDHRKIEAEKAAELAKILTPEELEDYQLRTHPTAMNMRAQLASFEPTEEEFREIFRARKEFDEEFGGFFALNPTNREVIEKKLAAQQELDQALAGVLGEERYAEYVREQDWAYRGAVLAAERGGQPKGTAVRIYDMKQIAEEQARKLRQDTSLSAEERAASLRALRSETERAVAGALGDQGFQAYKVQPGANWLQTLGPDQPRQ